jgi:hypothetical protein
MSATMFKMGFRAGGFQPLPIQLGTVAQDISTFADRIQGYTSEIRDLVGLIPGVAPTTPIKPPPPPPAPKSTILGLPSSAVIVGGALLLGGGVLAAVLLSRK